MKRRHVTNALFTLVEIYEEIREITQPSTCPLSKNTDSVIADVLWRNKTCVSAGYLITLNADVSNKPATKNLHLVQETQPGRKDSYIQVVFGQVVLGSWRVWIESGLN